jgi:hypothetical protein
MKVMKQLAELPTRVCTQQMLGHFFDSAQQTIHVVTTKF